MNNNIAKIRHYLELAVVVAVFVAVLSLLIWMTAVAGAQGYSIEVPGIRIIPNGAEIVRSNENSYSSSSRAEVFEKYDSPAFDPFVKGQKYSGDRKEEIQNDGPEAKIEVRTNGFLLDGDSGTTKT